MSMVRVDRCDACGALTGDLYRHRQICEAKPCADGVHYWPFRAEPGDTCNCGAWYRYAEKIVETPPRS